MSEATKFSPVPTPTIRGLECLAAQISDGLSTLRTARAYEPSTSFRALEMALGMDPVSDRAWLIRWTRTSVSV